MKKYIPELTPPPPLPTKTTKAEDFNEKCHLYKMCFSENDTNPSDIVQSRCYLIKNGKHEKCPCLSCLTVLRCKTLCLEYIEYANETILDDKELNLSKSFIKCGFSLDEQDLCRFLMFYVTSKYKDHSEATYVLDIHKFRKMVYDILIIKNGGGDELGVYHAEKWFNTSIKEGQEKNKVPPTSSSSEEYEKTYKVTRDYCFQPHLRRGTIPVKGNITTIKAVVEAPLFCTFKTTTTTTTTTDKTEPNSKEK